MVSLTTAFVLGTLIGAERQYRQRTAGLRTNVLVAVDPNELNAVVSDLQRQTGVRHATLGSQYRGLVPVQIRR